MDAVCEMCGSRKAAREARCDRCDPCWETLLDGRWIGPMARDELVRMLGAHPAGRDALVWREGVEAWSSASEIPEIARALGIAVSAAPARATARSSPLCNSMQARERALEGGAPTSGHIDLGALVPTLAARSPVVIPAANVPPPPPPTRRRAIEPAAFPARPAPRPRLHALAIGALIGGSVVAALAIAPTITSRVLAPPATTPSSPEPGRVEHAVLDTLPGTMPETLPETVPGTLPDRLRETVRPAPVAERGTITTAVADETRGTNAVASVARAAVPSAALAAAAPPTPRVRAAAGDSDLVDDERTEEPVAAEAVSGQLMIAEVMGGQATSLEATSLEASAAPISPTSAEPTFPGATVAQELDAPGEDPIAGLTEAPSAPAPAVAGELSSREGPPPPDNTPRSLGALLAAAVPAAPAASRPAPTAPTGDALPEIPSRESVDRALARARPAIQACGAEGHGLANVRIIASGATGRVTSARVEGPLAGTPAGSCVARAVRSMELPRFTRETFTLQVPFRI